jgi:hypothetical protein
MSVSVRQPIGHFLLLFGVCLYEPEFAGDDSVL